MPAGVGGCCYNRVNTHRFYGVNDRDASPYGPMEYGSYLYTPRGAGDCKMDQRLRVIVRSYTELLPESPLLVEG